MKFLIILCACIIFAIFALFAITTTIETCSLYKWKATNPDAFKDEVKENETAKETDKSK